MQDSLKALTFFHAQLPWLQKTLPEGETVIVSGKVEWFLQGTLYPDV